MKKILFLVFFFISSSASISAQWGHVSPNISMQKFKLLVKKNRVESVTRYNGEKQYNLHPLIHKFDKNGFLTELHSNVSMNGINTFENDSLGRTVKSYFFKYPKTDEYRSYTVRSFDELGNIKKSEHFYANGERTHFNETHQYSDEKYSYFTTIEAGEDSSVIRIFIDTVTQTEAVDYFSYRDGNLLSVDSYFEKMDEKGRKIFEGKIDYVEALMDWAEQNPEESQNLYSNAYQYKVIDSGNLDESLLEMDTTERYSYYENDLIKSFEDYSGIKKYEYDARTFPLKITQFDDRGKLERIINFIYDKKGLLDKEITTLPDGKVQEVLSYEYTFFED